jgi:phosphoribosylformylglycinamidine synthase
MQPFNEDKYPEEIRQVGIALALDQIRFNKIDACGAVNAVVESVRNVICVGATPFDLVPCFGNPKGPSKCRRLSMQYAH